MDEEEEKWWAHYMGENACVFPEMEMICTITGADDKVNITDLVALTKKYPFVEWGILHSEKAPHQRYPSLDWTYQLYNALESERLYNNLSAHLCDTFVDKWFDGEMQLGTQFSNHFAHFARMQINWNSKKKPYSDKILKQRLEDWYKLEIIMQYNKSSPNKEPLNHNQVFVTDHSGGRGTEITYEEYPNFSEDVSYGIAGGINPKNIDKHLRSIRILGNPDLDWIDMETGVRTNDEFDLDKVVYILEAVRKHNLEVVEHKIELSTEDFEVLMKKVND